MPGIPNQAVGEEVDDEEYGAGSQEYAEEHERCPQAAAAARLVLRGVPAAAGHGAPVGRIFFPSPL